MPLVHSQGPLDLFDTSARADPRVYESAFAEWLAAARQTGSLKRDSSTEMYGHMWLSWSTWAVGNGIGFEQVTGVQLNDYIESRGGADDLSARYTWRLLRLIERVMAGHAHRHGVAANFAATELMASMPAVRYANAPNADPLPEYLPAAEARQLVTYLTGTMSLRTASRLAWQDLRDRASVALMLGAGLTPGELRALEITDVIVAGGRVKDLPWKLKVAANGNSGARETPIAGWAGRVVRRWQEVRTEQAIPGTMLFPSTRTTGKPWGKVAQYEAAKEVLLLAGINSSEGGSFRLRHTFALRQLRKGKTLDEVGRWLGVSSPRVMANYQRILMGPVDLA